MDVVHKHKRRIGDDRFLIEKEFEYSGIARIPDPDSGEYKAVLATTMERALVTNFLLGTDKGKSDSLLRKLEQDYSLGSDLYPDGRNETLKILNTHLHSN